MELKDKNFICIPSFMRKEHDLKGNDMIIASIIYGFSQDRKTRFTGSLQYLQEWTGLTKHAVIDVLKKLIEKKIIVKNEEYINKVKFCSYSYNFTSGEETTPVVKNDNKKWCKNFTGGGEETTPNNIDIDNKDNNILTNVSSTDTTTNEAKPKDNEKEKTALAIPEKKAKKLESSDIAAAADPASRYGKFLLWMKQDTPYCYKNLTLPTEKQFEKLLNDYGGESVKDIVEEIENRKDKRKNYSNLNLTIRNWMKYRESKKQ